MTCIVTGHGKWRDKTAVSMTSRLCIYISIFAIKDTTCYLNDSRPATDDSLWEIRPSAYTDLYGWGKLLWPVSHSKHVYCNKNTRQRCTRFETIWTWTIYTSVWTVSQHKNTRYSTNSFIYISYFNMDFKPFCLNLFIYLFSKLFDVSTSSCAHLTIILSSSSICLCHSSLLPLIPFPPSVL